MEFNPLNHDSDPVNTLEIAAALQRVYRELPGREYQLDLHQDAAVQAVGAALAQGKRSGYVEMATSTGKTFIESVLAEATVRAGKRVLILAPSIQIANQISGHSSDSGLGKFSTLQAKGQVRQHYGTRRANDTAPVVVSTYPGLLGEIKNNTPRLGQFDVIIADECHRSLGQATSQALTTYMPGAVKIGFSATPDYADDRKSEEIYDQPLFEYSLLSAIEAGVTAPVRPIIYETDQTLELSTIRAEFTETELAPLIANMERNGAALRLVQDLVADGRQGIIACVPGLENGHARLMARLLSETPSSGRQVKAADVGSHLSREEQQRRLSAYSQGDIDVLTFTRTLEEGWDSQNASFCLNLAPTASPVRTKQLLGRILRPNSNDIPSVYVDFVDTMSGIAKQQYTAYHALELDDIDLRRTLGVKAPGTQPSDTHPHHTTNIDALFRDDIYQRLLRSHGKSLRDITLSKSSTAVDPLVLFWEKRLKEEGMPAELPDNIALPPKIDQAFRRTAARLLETSSTPLDILTIINETPGPNYHKALLAKFAVRVAWDDAIIDTFADPSDCIDETIEKVLTEQQRAGIDKALDSLSDREAGIIALRFGLGDNVSRMQDEIAEIYNITRSHVGQVESKTIAKLRHPFRSDPLEGLLERDDDVPAPRRTLPKPEQTGLLSDSDISLVDLQAKAEVRVSEYRMSLFSSSARAIKSELTDGELSELLRQTHYQIGRTASEAYNYDHDLAMSDPKTSLIARTRFQQAVALRHTLRNEQLIRAHNKQPKHQRE